MMDFPLKRNRFVLNVAGQYDGLVFIVPTFGKQSLHGNDEFPTDFRLKDEDVLMKNDNVSR